MARRHLGGRRLPQAGMSLGSGPCLKLEGRKFSQGSRGGSPELMQTWVLLQGAGRGSKERVTYSCQDRDEGGQSLESLGHVSFLSQRVAMFHNLPVLITRKLQ